jgi:hypothetical protein
MERALTTFSIQNRPETEQGHQNGVSSERINKVLANYSLLLQLSAVLVPVL